MGEGKEVNKQKTKPSEIFFGLVILVCIFGLPACIVWRITPNWILYPALYGARYQIGPKHVFVRRKPADCDWGHAPLGDKDCKYRKKVYTRRNAAGHVMDVLVTWEKVQD